MKHARTSDIVAKARALTPGAPMDHIRHLITAFTPDGKLPDRDFDLLSANAKIRCPACAWEPNRKSTWFCVSMGPPENFTGGCGHVWNTFDTRGECPSCKHQWRHTTCLRCHVTSLHDDWYVAGSGP
jgi:hypothetical protein